MQVGVTFPQNEIGADPGAIRDYVQTVEGLGYQHLVIYDHVLGVDPAQRPGWTGYTKDSLFHEPFVVLGYIAALTHLELVPGVIILPQRQTALVAKQAAEVDVLSGGKLRLGIGIGWNPVEYEALGTNFHARGKVVDEQIEVLRLLWSQEIVTYHGKYHTIEQAGLNPLPVHHSIPIWIGGNSPAALQRAARLGDGWLPLGAPDEQMRATLETLRTAIREAGRDPASFGIEARVSAADGPTAEQWVEQTQQWKEFGATHISLNTMGAGFTSLAQHLDALRRYKEALGKI